jgi:hypothetical protein
LNASGRVWCGPAAPRSELASEVGPSAFAEISCALLSSLELDHLLTPSRDFTAKPLVLRVVVLELVSAKPIEPREHVGEDSRVEAEVFLQRELAESLESVARLERHQVDEVSSLGAPEEREHLVDRELLAAEHRGEPPGFGRKEPCVRAQVELGAIVAALNGEASETGVLLKAVDDKTGFAEGTVDGRNEPVDSFRRRTEEVEIAGLSMNVAAGDQGGAAGECEAFRFLKTGDDLGDLLLKRAQQLPSAAVTFDPLCPRASNRRWQHEVIPELEQLVGVHVETHVVFGPFAQNLLIDAGPVGTVVEVVAQGWPAPANVERKLDSPARLGANRLAEVVRHGHRPCCGAELASSGVRHR